MTPLEMLINYSPKHRENWRLLQQSRHVETTPATPAQPGGVPIEEQEKCPNHFGTRLPAQ